MNSRTVLVTGAGSGLGFEAAIHLAAKGWRVFGAVLSREEAGLLRQSAAARGVTIDPVEMDVTVEAQVRSAIDTVIQECGRLDDVVQFAGLGLRGFFEDISDAEVRRVFDVNVFGMMNVARAVLPHMRANRSGRLVFTSSVAGRMASMSIGGYASSKFAVEGFAECLRQEAALFGIHVSLLEPGLVATPHFTIRRNRAKAALDPTGPYYAWFCQHERIVDRILAKNSFTPSDIAEVVFGILSERRPKLRYMVGWRAKLIVNLRRYTPGEWFESLYWGMVRRMVTSPKHSVRTLTGVDQHEFSPASRSNVGPE